MTLNIQDIPLEVFLDHLLPAVDVPDLLALACTSRFFALLCADDTFWKNKLKDDMNYSIVDARNKGFKLLYRGIRRPHVYVWGTKDNGRLGMDTDHIYDGQDALRAGVPFPVELPMNDTRIVSIVAGGWSFAALDEQGCLHVWGQLDAEGMRENYGTFGDSVHLQKTPATLKLPEPLVSISAGRRHLFGLDAKHQLWLFTSWGRPARITSVPPIKDIAQVESGWDMIAVLTETSRIFVDWPFHGDLQQKIQAHHDALSAAPNRGQDTKLPEDSNVLQCAAWELEHDFVELPAIPAALPVLNAPSVDDRDHPEETKVIRIAAGDDFIVALTNYGHVLKINVTPGDSIQQLRDDLRYGKNKWTYLSEFSELHCVQASFRAEGVQAPQQLRISHISATFHTFAAYSTGTSSVVLLGDAETNEASIPNIIPALQSRNIVSVVLGDYHFAALNEDGTMYTWGQYSNGALGLGDPASLPVGSPGAFTEPIEQNAGQRVGPGMFRGPLIPGAMMRQHRDRLYRTPPDVLEPTAVRFDHVDGKRDKFVFQIAASGWQTAALVIDMEPEKAPTNAKAKPSSSSGFGAGFVGGSNPPRNPPSETHDDSDEDAPQMPGAFFPGSGSSRNHHSTRGTGDVLPLPYPRVFAPSEPPVGNLNQQRGRGRGMHGLPYVGRIGFAGRGMVRGAHTPAGIVPGGWQHTAGQSTPADYEERLQLQAASEAAASAPESPEATEQENQHDAETETSPGSSNHPLPIGLRGVRIGYAGRGAFRGRGFGRVLAGDTPDAEDDASASSPATSGDRAPLRERGGGPGPGGSASTQPEPDADEETEDQAPGGSQSQVPRGLRGVRIGYAGRGAYRGNGFGRVLAGGFRGLPPRRGGGGGTSDSTEHETDTSGSRSGNRAAEHGGETEEKK